jgi:hypothetical protein
MGRRRRQRKQGSGLAIASGLALVGFWLVSGLAGGAGAVEAEAPVPTVTVQARGDGQFTLSTPACATASSTSLAPGIVEVRRTGPTVGALTLQYGVTADDQNDFEPLPGTVTIPAGQASTLVVVTPRFVDRPPPVSVHRDAPVSIRVFDEAAYNLNGGGTATVTLRFDVDVDTCPTAPAGEGPAPEPEPVSSVRAATATAPTATSPPATLPFTGSPVTNALAGTGTALIALGGAGLRYGRPRARRMQARRRRQARR